MGGVSVILTEFPPARMIQILFFTVIGNSMCWTKGEKNTVLILKHVYLFLFFTHMNKKNVINTLCVPLGQCFFYLNYWTVQKLSWKVNMHCTQVNQVVTFRTPKSNGTAWPGRWFKSASGWELPEVSAGFTVRHEPPQTSLWDTFSQVLWVLKACSSSSVSGKINEPTSGTFGLHLCVL